MDRVVGKNLKRVIIMSAAAVAALTLLTAFILLADFDRDGLKNTDELSIGTGMLNPDTDGDELEDGLEVNVYGTDPLATDSDNDGLEDGTEVNGSWHVFELKQIRSEDFDYSIHWTLEHKVWEEENYRTYYSWNGESWAWPYDYEKILIENGILHTTSDPLSMDTDADGLNDRVEYEIGTNPRSKDSDNDGIEDIVEIYTRKTIPIFYDTDGDLMGDGEEIDKYSTDPLNWDSDNDHLSDGIEIKGYDVDDDGIIEVNFPAYGANPLVNDIFVEVDWMPGAKTLGSYSEEKLVEAFANHGMVLHIDQGELGGGSETYERADRLYDNRPGPMNDFFDFKDKYFTPWRRGVFFWCLMTTSTTYIGQEAVGGFNYADGFTVAGTWPTDASLGSIFMHEFGHALSLSSSLFDGIDSKKYSFDEYRSVMNYNAPYHTGGEFYDYSEGAPFNDWVHLNFDYLTGRY
ncbi:MAG: hypothetical protein ABH852_01960 [Methanobacteriota archaeon]